MKYVTGLLALVVLIAAVNFAIFNPTLVEIDPLWPLPFAFKAPAFVLALGGLAIGLLFGAGLMWLATARARMFARRSQRTIDRLTKELHDLHHAEKVVATPQALG